MKEILSRTISSLVSPGNQKLDRILLDSNRKTRVNGRISRARLRQAGNEFSIGDSKKSRETGFEDKRYKANRKPAVALHDTFDLLRFQRRAETSTSSFQNTSGFPIKRGKRRWRWRERVHWAQWHTSSPWTWIACCRDVEGNTSSAWKTARPSFILKASFFLET